MKVYCDTCLYLDIFLARKDRFRDLADMALQIFRRVEEGEFTLVVSDWLIEELLNHIEKEKIEEFLKPFHNSGRIIKVFKQKEYKNEAKKISPYNYQDALHAILANKAGAKYLLTRNIKDFAGCEHLVKIKLPESV